MLSVAEGVVWASAVAVAVMTTFPQAVEAVLGIPDFLEMGKCAKVPLKPDFDPVKYSGLWFDIESVPNQYQHTKKCVTQNYTWKGDFMQVATRGLTTENKKVRQSAVMRVEKKKVKSPDPAYMTVEASGVPAAPYQIVSSDYRTYACVYSCLEYFGFRAEFFWIFGRNPMLPAEKIKLCHTAFESLKINYKKMVPIVQGEPCPYADKLDDMLHQNEQYLDKVLGPYVPTSSVPTPLPPTTEAAVPQPDGAVEEELKEIKEIVEQEKKLLKEFEVKFQQNPSGNPFLEPVTKSAQENTQEMSDDPNAANILTSPASLILCISLLVTGLLHQ